MMVSTKGRYALRMVVDIAENQHLGNVALKAVARRQEISEKYMESIAKQLVGAGLLLSSRGKAGGYRLAREASEITAGDVVRAAENEMISVACQAANADLCERADSCRTVAVWRGLDDVVRKYLDGITIADLAMPDLAGNDYVI